MNAKLILHADASWLCMRPGLLLKLFGLGWLALLLASCTSPKETLHLFIWSEFIPPKIIADFERQFDCRVTVDFYEDPDSMMAKLAAGGTSLYDVIAPSDTGLPALVSRQLVAPLRHENIPNLKHLDARFVSPPFDPGNQFSAALSWGTTGIYLRKAKGQSVEESWAVIFDPAKQPGPFLLLEDVRPTIGAALRYKGYSLNSTNPTELAQARDLLVEAKQRSLGFEGGTGCKNRVLAKGAALAMAYNGDAIRGIAEDPETIYFVPREGTQIYVDVLCVPAQAPHRDLAEKFINYMLEPKVSAEFAEQSQFATANQSALEHVSPAHRKNPGIYPPAEFGDRLEYARDLGAANQLYDEIWTQIKAR